MKKTKKSPVPVKARQVRSIKAVGAALDTYKPNEVNFDTQAKMLATIKLMKQARISIWHAKSIVDAQNLGGC